MKVLDLVCVVTFFGALSLISCGGSTAGNGTSAVVCSDGTCLTYSESEQGNFAVGQQSTTGNESTIAGISVDNDIATVSCQDNQTTTDPTYNYASLKCNYSSNTDVTALYWCVHGEIHSLIYDGSSYSDEYAFGCQTYNMYCDEVNEFVGASSCATYSSLALPNGDFASGENSSLLSQYTSDIDALIVDDE